MTRHLKLAALAMLCLALGACAGRTAVGPVVTAPETVKKTFALWPQFTPVASTTPSLSWESFPDYLLARGDIDPETKGLLEGAANVRYELRIWQELQGAPGTLAYQRQGLIDTEHVVSPSLKPATRYFWSVRASYEIDGKRRVTPWAQYAGLMNSRSIPNPACYRFQTP